MNGCYQCGAADGSETDLCEVCHQRRFHQDVHEVVLVEPDGPVDGLEWSPRTQHAILSGGAFVYISVILLCGLITVRHLQHPAHISADGRFEFVPAGDSVTEVHEEVSVGSVGVR